MKRHTLLLALFSLAISSGLVQAQTPIDYTTAYERAQTGDKPLLVLITAKWCPPCQVMKKTTIPELMKRDAFKDCHWATVDLDEEQSLAKQLIGTRGVPQLIMYEKRDGKWVRRYLTGYKTAHTVEAFVAQAQSIRTAEVMSNNLDK